jgi:putative nucleotidyltransferase with HDIG domain
MTKRAVSDFLRRFLTSLIERIDSGAEPASARSKPERWFEKEFHLPPAVVGVTAAVLLYAVLALNAELSARQAIGLAMFVSIVMILFTVYLHRDQKDLVKSDDAMALLAVIFFTTLIWIKVIAVLSLRYHWITPYLTPVALAPLLAALLLNARLAMVTSFAVSLIFGLVNGFSLQVAMVGAIGGATMVATVTTARTAHSVARAGLIVGVIQAVVVGFLAVMQNWTRGHAGTVMASAFIGGIGSAMFALGVLPYLESFFSRISNLRVVELASANHPLLQRMSMDAPGTYHHSLIVASLAEDAANAIGANGLLCRVGAYFHDIGKMVKAEYFIENQGTFRNPHDQVSPSLSKLVITSHVKEGMALAKAHRLDKQIADFIPQHHGTSQIEFFYQKALKLEESEDEPNREDVPEESYRYPGPTPQTKEAGIVMLADSVEATSRTLEEPNHQRFKDVVNKIVNKKLFDGQLDETPLTLRDLHLIAERFTASLTSIHHARIAYPETAKKKEETPFQ